MLPIETTRTAKIAAQQKPRKRTPAFDSKRVHLFSTAARVFSEVGYDRASMRRIADEAQVSLAGI